MINLAVSSREVGLATDDQTQFTVTKLFIDNHLIPFGMDMKILIWVAVGTWDQGGIHAAYARDLWCGVTIIYCSSIVLPKMSGVNFACFQPGT